MTRIVLSDGDSTLINTPKLITELPHAAEKVFGTDKIQSQAFEDQIRSKAFYAPSGAGYDLARHLQAYGIKPTADNRAELIGTLLKTGSYVYPDVADFVSRMQTDPTVDYFGILTVGVLWTQELKLELCADILAGVPYEITEQKNKGVLLSTYWSNGIVYKGMAFDSAAIVDDSEVQLLALPKRPEIELWQISRPKQRYPRSVDSRINVRDTLDTILR